MFHDTLKTHLQQQQHHHSARKKKSNLPLRSQSKSHYNYHFLLFVLSLLLTLLLEYTQVIVAFEPPIPPKSTVMRAWTCHGKSQKEMVDRLMQANIIQSKAVRNVMYQVDRGNYIMKNPYLDSPQAIGLGQTISAPHMHAHSLEQIYPYIQKTPSTQEVKILDVGCGSGYLTAAFGRWLQNRPSNDNNKNNKNNIHHSSVGGGGNDDDNNGANNNNDTTSTCSLFSNTISGRTGKVFGIDVKTKLVDQTRSNIMKQDHDLLTHGTVSLQVADGWKGLPEQAPFDAIHVGAAAESLPIALAEQLKVGGVLIIPVGPEGGIQELYRMERLAQSSSSYTPQDYRVTQLLSVRYVPLVQPE